MGGGEESPSIKAGDNGVEGMLDMVFSCSGAVLNGVVEALCFWGKQQRACQNGISEGSTANNGFKVLELGGICFQARTGRVSGSGGRVS